MPEHADVQAPKQKTSIKSVTNERFPGRPIDDIANIDRFLIANFFDKQDWRLFSKAGLYRGVEGSASRPRTHFIELTTIRNRTDDEAQKGTQPVIDLLNENGSLYLKNSMGSMLSGIMKIEKGEKNLYFKIPNKETVNQITRNLSRNSSSERADYVLVYPGENLITAPLNQPGLIQTPEEVISFLMKYGFDEGEYIAEAPIKIPKFNGSTWEIRNIVQCPGGIPQITARFAKLGAGEDFSNLVAGGTAELPEDVIRGIYQNKQDAMDPDEATKTYLELNTDTALKVAAGLNKYMNSLAKKYFSDKTDELFFAREFGVDITAEFDENGKLRPVLGEIQYPMRPVVSYIPELEKVDPAGLKRIEEVQEKIAELDKRLLKAA